MSEGGRVFRSDPPRLLLALAVIVIGVALWQLASGIRGGSEEEPEATVATLAQPDLDPQTLDRGWVRIDLPGRAPLEHLQLVDATLYAAGWNAFESQTEVWRSVNGREWQRVPDPNGVFVDAIINDFIAVDGVVVAVGAGHTVGAGGDVVRPVVWRSQDGASFTRLSDERVKTDSGSDLPTGGGFEAVAQVGGRLVAVGWQGEGRLRAPGAESLGGVWVSEFGDTWELAFEDPELLGGPGTTVHDVAVTDDGVAVAAGSSEGIAKVWESTDGVTWVASSDEAALAFRGPGDWEATAVAVSPPRALVLGTSRNGTEAAVLRMWSQRDGVWAPVAIPELADVTLVSVSDLRPGFLAVGSRALPSQRTAAGMWASPDGADWSRVDVEDAPVDETALLDVAVHPSGLVAVGAVFDQPAAWYRPREGGDEEDVAAGAPLPPPAWATIFQEQEPSRTAPRELINAGGMTFGLSDTRTLWASLDGRAWAPGRFDDIGLAAADEVVAIVGGGDGPFVLIGDGDQPGVWLSGDGSTWTPPTKAPPCCIRAVFPRNDGGFRALGQDPADNAWFLAVSEDGTTWAVNPELPDLLDPMIWEFAHIGAIDLVWTSDGTETRAWSSADGISWTTVDVPEVTRWTNVWSIGGVVYAAAQTPAGAALYRTNGVRWDPVDLEGIDLAATSIRGVAALENSLALVISQPGRPQRLYQVLDGALPVEIPLAGTRGFGGLWAALVPDGEQLRVVGPAHGRMTVWEWVPAE